MNTFDITLDLSKRGPFQSVPIRQGDKSGTTIRATITDHGVAASTEGMTARFSMRLPDGTHYYRKAASLSGNVATVTLDEAQAASAVGRTDVAYFQLLQGSTVVASTKSFTIVVLPDALADAEVAESYDSAIQDAIDNLDAAVENLPSTVEDVLTDHPEWTTTVQDGSITEAKLATDLARDRERLLYRLDNLLTASLPEGDVATASDAAQTPVAGLALYGRSTQDGTPTPSAPVAIQSVTPNIAVTPYTHFDYASSRGVAYTQNADGSITASGTAGSSLAYLELCTHIDNTFGLERGKTYTLVVSSGNVALLTITGGSSNNKVAVVTVPTSGNWTVGVGVLAGRTVNETFRFSVFEGDVTALSPVPYNSVGLFAVGRNLLNPAQEFGGATYYTVNADGTLTVTAEDTRGWASLPVAPLGAGTFTLSIDGNADGRVTFRAIDGSSETSRGIIGSGSDTFTLTSGGGLRIKVHQGTFPRTVRIQVERGSTATAYQPYESTVTPITLDGHELRSLPDGTRDELTVDERGHAVLVQRVQLTTQAVTDGVTGTVGVDVMSSTGAIANGATVLYPLATPQTIDLGYIDTVPLCGPDLTAQAIPTAPMQLTYERDLNVTLARLESAIATLA